MSVSRTQLEALSLNNDDGDTLAALALRDAQEENGSVYCEPIKVGDWAYIYTASHAFVGRLSGVDHEEYVLEAPVAWVFETGELGHFFGKGEGEYVEIVDTEHRPRRGAVVLVARWPHERLPTQKKK